MSLQRKVNRGKNKIISNPHLKRYEHYRLSKRGKWILTNPFLNIDIIGASPLHKKQMNKLIEP